MKKAFLSVAIAAMVAVSANAQNVFKKGDWLAGVQGTGLGFESHFNDGSGGSRQYDAGVFGGWFLLDKLAFDVMAGFSHTHIGTTGTPGSIKTSTFDFGGGVRYYPVGNLFARLGYHGKTGTNRWAQYLGVKVGYDVFLSENVFIEPAVYWEKNMEKNWVIDTGRENVLGLSIGIGMRF